MRTDKQHRRTWLNVIGWVLAGALALDVVSVPLLIVGHGAPTVGTVPVGAIINGQPYVDVQRHLPDLFLGPVSLHAGRPSRTQDLLYALGNGLAVMLVLIPLLVLAIRLIEHARHHDPFTPQTVRRLRRLGLSVLVLGLLSGVVEYAAQTALLDISLPPDHALRFDATISHYPTPWWLLPGLMLLAFAEIVRHGWELRAELDEVI